MIDLTCPQCVVGALFEVHAHLQCAACGFVLPCCSGE